MGHAVDRGGFSWDGGPRGAGWGLLAGSGQPAAAALVFGCLWGLIPCELLDTMLEWRMNVTFANPP